MQDHRKLRAYQESKRLAVSVYRVAASLPPIERFELACQLRRAAVSVGSNIAEGCGRASSKDLATFLGTALGSAMELEFQLELCEEVQYAAPSDIVEAIESAKQVQRMLSVLIVRVRGS